MEEVKKVEQEELKDKIKEEYSANEAKKLLALPLDIQKDYFDYIMDKSDLFLNYYNKINKN